LVKNGRTTGLTIDGESVTEEVDVGGLGRFPGNNFAFASILQNISTRFTQKGDSGGAVGNSETLCASAIIEGFGYSETLKTTQRVEKVFVVEVEKIFQRVKEKFGVTLEIA
jgi:hypothetical protein